MIEELRISNHKISLQLDESTDISNCCQLMVFVKYIKDGEIKEEFLFCRTLKSTSKGLDIYNILNHYFHTKQLNFDMIGSICTDGAPAMLGNKSGLKGILLKETPNIIVTHCIIHRQILAAKTLPENFKNCLNTLIKMINFIKSSALNTRIFKLLCEEMGSKYDNLLYHTEVRWLLRGKCLSRIFELKYELREFLFSKTNVLYKYLDCENFNAHFSYLVDIFSHLNDLNLSLQGRNKNILHCWEKLNGFKGKLNLWNNQIKTNNYKSFTKFRTFMNKSNINNEYITNDISNHLISLLNSFENYFHVGSLNFEEYWIINPFAFNLDELSDNNIYKENSLDLKTDRSLKLFFETVPLDKFWVSIQKSFKIISHKALSILVVFSTTYLCESGFSTLLTLKTKKRNKLNVENDIRISLSNFYAKI